MNKTIRGVRTIIDNYAYQHGFRVSWSGRHELVRGHDDDAGICDRTIYLSKRFSTPGKLALAFCHEISHHAVDQMPHERRRTQLEDELNAWALTHKFHRKIFKCNPDPKDERYITQCIKTYTR